MFDSSSTQWVNANPTYVTTLTATLGNAVLYPYSSYNVSVTAQNIAGAGKSVYVMQTTNTTKPSAPPSFIAVGEVTSDTLTFHWSEPPCGTRHGEIVSYSFTMFTFIDENSIIVMNGTTSSLEVVIGNLKPKTGYMFQVAAVNSAGEGSLSDLLSVSTKQVDIRAPKKIPDLDAAQFTSTTVTMILPEIDNKYVTGYQVGVEIKESQRKRQTRRFGHYFDSKEAYVTAELLVDDVIEDPTFVVGDGEFYGEYYNAPLQENQTYTLYVAFIRQTNSTAYVANWSEGTDVTTRSCCSCPVSSRIETRSENGTAHIITSILVSLLCVSALAHVAMSAIMIRLKKKLLNHKQDHNPATMAAPPTISNPGSGANIQMSLDGYVEYKHDDQPESTYQGIKEDVQGDDTYDEIPVSINTTSLVSPGHGNKDDGAYTNDSVIQPGGSKQPQKKPDQAGIYEVSN